MTTLTCRVVEPSEVDDLDEDWDGLLARGRFDHVFATPGYARAWRRTLGRRWTPQFVVVESGSEVRLLAPLSSRPEDPGTWRFSGDRRADYTDLIHAAGDHAAIDALLAFVASRRSGCSRLVLRNLPGDADILDALPLAVVEGGWRQRLPSLLDRPLATQFARDEHPLIDRAGLVELRDKLTTSRNASFKLRRLAKTGPVSFRKTTDPAEVLAALPAFFALHRVGSLAQGRHSPFEDPHETEFVEALVEELAPHRAVRLDQLFAGDHLVAAHLGFEWANRLLWYKPCFDPAHARSSPGKLLLLHLTADAHDLGFDELDLLKGTEGYKYEVATGVRRTGGLDVYATRRAWLSGRGDG